MPTNSLKEGEFILIIVMGNISPGVLLVVPLSPAEGLVLLQRKGGVEGRGRGGGEVDQVQVGIVGQHGILTSLLQVRVRTLEGEILNISSWS